MYINYLILYGKFFKRRIFSARKFTYYNCNVKTDCKMCRNIIDLLKQGRSKSERECYLSNVHFLVCITLTFEKLLN